LSTWLVGIVAQCPNITRIDKGSAFEFPKQLGAILYTCIELDITRLIQEVSIAGIATWS
jgi:hypothetical protein